MFVLFRSRTGVASSIAVLVALLAGVASCGKKSPTEPTGTVEIIDLTVGAGPEAMRGRVIAVHYTGWVADDTKPDRKGTQFETSVGGNPFTFQLGISAVIQGWQDGIPGMRVGGKRRLIIPPGLAYGSTGAGPIPPNATLVFDIDLVAVQ